ncbi:hypothetical protein D1122_21590 [Cereibacter sphaeroides]|nr:hypothetical protein D1122_21590 [Cereibacter sphaeroides]
MATRATTASPTAAGPRAAGCGSPSAGRRKLIEARPSEGSPFVDEALRRIADLYAVEKEIRGQAPEARRAVRQERSKPLIEAMHP